MVAKLNDFLTKQPKKKKTFTFNINININFNKNKKKNKILNQVLLRIMKICNI